MSSGVVIAILLALAVIGSAVGTVAMHHHRRAFFIELQRLEFERDALQVEWGKLQLEQSTWADHERIIRLAGERLRLRSPSADQVVLVVP